MEIHSAVLGLFHADTWKDRQTARWTCLGQETKGKKMLRSVKHFTNRKHFFSILILMICMSVVNSKRGSLKRFKIRVERCTAFLRERAYQIYL
jgi:hypothetical protein